MLEVKNISKSFASKKVLDNISFILNDKTITSYLGKNGSGKTTTFHIILSLLASDEGQILLNNKVITNKDVSYLPETKSLYYDTSVYEQLTLIGKLNSISSLDYKIDNYLKQLGISQYKDVVINRLSKGNQQKVSLACCLLKEASLYILDEPFTGLDSENINIFTRLILQLKDQGKMILLSSHQYQAINQICDHYIYLEDGHIKYNLDKQQINSDERRVVEVFDNCDTTIDYPFVIKTVEKEYSSKYLLPTLTQANNLIHLLNKNCERITCSHLSIDDYIEFKL